MKVLVAGLLATAATLQLQLVGAHRAAAARAGGAFVNGGSPPGISLQSDCALRRATWEFGKHLQPSQGTFAALHDAMQLGSACNVSLSGAGGHDATAADAADAAFDVREVMWTPPVFDEHGKLLFVDANTGNDGTGDGTEGSPFKTIQRGVAAARDSRGPTGSGAGSVVAVTVTLLLRAGTFYLDAPVLLTETDSNIIIQNYRGEDVSISGGVLLRPSWQPAPPPPPPPPPPLPPPPPPPPPPVPSGAWKLYANENNVYGRALPKRDHGPVLYLGTFSSAQDCLNAVNSSHRGPFTSFTWNPAAHGSGAYSGMCYGITDGSWLDHTQAGFVSGRRQQVPQVPQVTGGAGAATAKPGAVFVTKVGGSLAAVPGLRRNGKRCIRARFPNIADAESHMSIHAIDGWIGARTTWVPPVPPAAPAIEINASAREWPGMDWPMNESGGVPLSETGTGGQGFYTMGLGGPCNEMDPPYGYACAAGGGPRHAGQHMHPSGLVYTSTLLPHAPYRRPQGAVVHAWRPAHWFTVQFEVAATTSNTTLTFSRGGNQGSEGFSSGAEWFVGKWPGGGGCASRC